MQALDDICMDMLCATEQCGDLEAYLAELFACNCGGRWKWTAIPTEERTPVVVLPILQIGLVAEESSCLESVPADWLRRVREVLAPIANLYCAAYYDSLTGVLNRCGFFSAATKRLAQAAGNSQGFLILFDVDDLKTHNDHYSHSHGDCILQQTVQKLRVVVPEDGLLGRIGGDEFALLVHPFGRCSAERPPLNLLAKRVCDLLCQSEDQNRSEEIRQATFSGGIALYPQNGRDLKSLLANADEALYQAKHKGKSCLCLLEEKRIFSLADRNYRTA